jgi:Uncharacterized protein conserved in bacteria
MEDGTTYPATQRRLRAPSAFDCSPIGRGPEPNWRQRCAAKGVPDGAASTVLDRFAEVGLINDAVIAENYALVQHRQRGLAARAVAGKLRRRGLDEDSIRTALMPIDASSEQAAASALVARRLRTLRRLEPSVQARRVYGLLARRGYSASIATAVITALIPHTDIVRLIRMNGDCRR